MPLSCSKSTVNISTHCFSNTPPPWKAIQEQTVSSLQSHLIVVSTVTFKHIDSTNVPFGFCAILACGSYNYTKEHHMILLNLGLVIQFPPGSTILIPFDTL